jgi:hypothetical protein
MIHFKFWKIFLGSDKKSSERVEAKTLEADLIKAQTMEDITRTKENIDKINRDTNIKLKNVSKDLNQITIRFAIGMGRIKGC